MPKNTLENEIEYVMSLAIEKCGNLADAQDLTQETILSAIIYLRNGGIIENTRAFLSILVRRKYYNMLRAKYKLPTVTIGEDFDIADENNFTEDLIKREDAENIRREVAYLTKIYRKVTVLYYFNNKSVNEIAKELKISAGTVKSRLNFGRKQIKKGIENMEKYHTNSYMPQYLAVRNSGTFGMNGEPMSLTDDDILAQNLLILAYDKPISVSELSKCIGVATAYVEPIVDKLVEGELMKRMGDGKVYTDFVIYHANDFVKYIHEAEAFTEKHIKAYTDPLNKAIEELKATSFYSERLERFMMINIADAGLYSCMESVRKPQIFPDRPNGGKWIAFATIYPENYSIPDEYRGKEEYLKAGKRCTSIGRYLEENNLSLYNFETSLDANMYKKHSGYDFNSFQDLEFNMLKLFYLIKHNIKPENVGIDERIIKGMSRLEEHGFITTKNGTPELLIPVLTHAQEKVFWQICDKAQKAFGDNIKEYLAEYCKTHKKEIPPHLTSVPDQKLTMPFEPSCMMFVYEAIRQGIHPRNLGYPCPETIAVFD